jgi:hypothetical protein
LVRAQANRERGEVLQHIAAAEERSHNAKLPRNQATEAPVGKIGLVDGLQDGEVSIEGEHMSANHEAEQKNETR